MIAGPSTCYRCGTDDVVIATEDYAVCDSCERDHRSFLAAEYPYGQCPTCGAEGFQINGRIVYGWEVGGHHVEGACGSWSDPGEGPY